MQCANVEQETGDRRGDKARQCPAKLGDTHYTRAPTEVNGIADVCLEGWVVDYFADAEAEHDNDEDAVFGEERAERTHQRHCQQSADQNSFAPKVFRDCAKHGTEQPGDIGQCNYILNVVGGDAEGGANGRDERVGETPRNIDRQATTDDGENRAVYSVAQAGLISRELD